MPGTYRIFASNTVLEDPHVTPLWKNGASIQVTQRDASKVTSPFVTDLWWGGSLETGWGVSIVQHGEQLFATIYVYDESGNPTWLVMTGGSWSADKTRFTGDAFSPRGSPFYEWEPTRFVLGQSVGSIVLTFQDAEHATLDVNAFGSRTVKAITRFRFGPVDHLPVASLGDMWWGGPLQSGWGVALLQQYRSLFSIIYTYDKLGRPTWIFSSAGKWTTGDGRYDMTYSRTRGATWLYGRTYDAAALQTMPDMTAWLEFEGGGMTLSYVLPEGNFQVRRVALTRFAF